MVVGKIYEGITNFLFDVKLSLCAMLICCVYIYYQINDRLIFVDVLGFHIVLYVYVRTILMHYTFVSLTVLLLSSYWKLESTLALVEAPIETNK